MLASDSARVVVFSPYGRSAGSVRTRVHEWLERLDVPREVHGFLDRNTAGFNAISHAPVAAARAHLALRAGGGVGADDIVLIHREASPLSDGRLEERLLCAGGRGVFDLDDGIQWDWGDGGVARRWLPKADKTIRMVRAADVVIAGNDLIAEWAGSYARHVVVIPTCVDPKRYTRKRSYELGTIPRLGWIGSAATEGQLASMTEALESLHRRTGARVQLVGDPRPKLGSLEAILDRVPWSEANAYALPAEWDVGLMPVPDGLLQRAKCGYKALQYGAAALPVACSPVGVNAEILGRSDESITEQLDELVTTTAAAREERGDALHERVRARYSYDAHLDRWTSAVFGINPNSAGVAP